MTGVIAEDQKLINTTAKKLEKKYSKTRVVDEKKLLREKKWWQRALTYTLNAVLAFFIVFVASFSVSVVISKLNNTVPNYAGYSVLRIVSGSMTASGFQIGQTIVVQSVDTDTLNVGDDIAFYVYQKNYSRYNSKKAHLVTEDNGATKSKVELGNFIGIHSTAITEAAKANSKIVFHKIMEIYEDENGERWFKTKGTSNGSMDSWITSEQLIVGKYTDSGFAMTLASVLSMLTNNAIALMVAIMLPFIVLALMIGAGFIKDIELAWLELDVVEEKRKLTDEICVKHKIGIRMDKKTKYKVLAQAKPEERMTYMALLWGKGEVPASVRKYYLRKELLLKKNQQLLELNRECQQMFKDGVSATKIATHYNKEKDKIEKENEKRTKRLEAIRKSYKQSA